VLALEPTVGVSTHKAEPFAALGCPPCINAVIASGDHKPGGHGYASRLGFCPQGTADPIYTLRTSTTAERHETEQGTFLLFR
jgi:hypothetical protein